MDIDFSIANTNDLVFDFPSINDRKVPRVVAQKWQHHSYWFFFHNGLCDPDAIQRFLMAQNLDTLDCIASAFDLEIIDLVSDKRKVEGVILTTQDKPTIVEAILSSVTK